MIGFQPSAVAVVPFVATAALAKLNQMNGNRKEDIRKEEKNV
jgi:hypothetical protein